MKGKGEKIWDRLMVMAFSHNLVHQGKASAHGLMDWPENCGSSEALSSLLNSHCDRLILPKMLPQLNHSFRFYESVDHKKKVKLENISILYINFFNLQLVEDISFCF